MFGGPGNTHCSAAAREAPAGAVGTQGFLCLPWGPPGQAVSGKTHTPEAAARRQHPARRSCLPSGTGDLRTQARPRQQHGGAAAGSRAPCGPAPGSVRRSRGRRPAGSPQAQTRRPRRAAARSLLAVRGPYRLFQAETRSSASCCSRLSPQYSPTITWSHSALPRHATTVRSGLRRLRAGDTLRRPRRQARAAMARSPAPPPLPASAPCAEAASGAGGECRPGRGPGGVRCVSALAGGWAALPRRCGEPQGSHLQRAESGQGPG